MFPCRFQKAALETFIIVAFNKIPFSGVRGFLHEMWTRFCGIIYCANFNHWVYGTKVPLTLVVCEALRVWLPSIKPLDASGNEGSMEQFSVPAQKQFLPYHNTGDGCIPVTVGPITENSFVHGLSHCRTYTSSTQVFLWNWNIYSYFSREKIGKQYNLPNLVILRL